MTYTTNNSLEQLELFTETDMESVQIESNELEMIESMLQENLENISLESVATDVEEYMEEGIESRVSNYSVNRQLIKVVTLMVRQAVKKITMNPRTRSKLHAACRKGPTTVSKLLTPIVASSLPRYLRFLAFTFCLPVITRLFRNICKDAGLKPEQIEAAPEFRLGLSIGW